MFYSPLRYPGGKNKLSKFISQICIENNIDGLYIEPYAGGASVALYLLLEGYVNKIYINDIDRSIYSFWYSVLFRTKELCDLIDKTDVSMENWHRTRKIQKQKETADVLQLGFSTFFQNRTNRSGIIDAGVIGGKNQLGKYKMDCRFNKVDLIERINRIAEKRNQIKLYNLDALELLEKIDLDINGTNNIIYFDPPYYFKGSSLYENHYRHEDHIEVSEKIRSMKNARWIVSYDNTPEINKIYSWVKNKYPYSIAHTAHTNKKGKEMLFFSKNIPNIPLLSQFLPR